MQRDFPRSHSLLLEGSRPHALRHPSRCVREIRMQAGHKLLYALRMPSFARPRQSSREIHGYSEALGSLDADQENWRHVSPVEHHQAHLARAFLFHRSNVPRCFRRRLGDSRALCGRGATTHEDRRRWLFRIRWGCFTPVTQYLASEIWRRVQGHGLALWPPDSSALFATWCVLIAAPMQRFRWAGVLFASRTAGNVLAKAINPTLAKCFGANGKRLGPVRAPEEALESGTAIWLFVASAARSLSGMLKSSPREPTQGSVLERRGFQLRGERESF